jgi:hypothetical protein
MSDYQTENYRNTDESWQRKGARFVRYLTTRKSETWFFFIAGFVIASILN